MKTRAIKLFEEFHESTRDLADRFLAEIGEEYDLRRGKPFDRHKGNCAWFTSEFSRWADKNRVQHEIVYFPDTNDAPDAHIAPMVGDEVIDFAHKQFSNDPDEAYRISKPDHYMDYGYRTWEVWDTDELRHLQTVHALDKK